MVKHQRIYVVYKPTSVVKELFKSSAESLYLSSNFPVEYSSNFPVEYHKCNVQSVTVQSPAVNFNKHMHSNLW